MFLIMSCTKTAYANNIDKALEKVPVDDLEEYINSGSSYFKDNNIEIKDLIQKAFKGELDISLKEREYGGVQLLDKDVDGPATGQAHVPDHVLGDAEVQFARSAAVQDVHHLLIDGGLDAAAADRARHAASRGDDHLGAHRPRCRADDADHRRHGDLFAFG